jgi:hypothetical protein
MMNIPLTIKSRNEYYYGEATGKVEYYATAAYPTPEGAPYIGGVAGRSTHSPANAVADWTRRAQDDGLAVIGVVS